MLKTRHRIDLDLIDDNPWQPRLDMSAAALQDIADSIDQLGLLQEPLARPSPTHAGRFQTAHGHRRIGGCRLLHQQGRRDRYIEMDAADLTDEEMAVIALTENESRKQLTQIEVVKAHKRAIEETSLTAPELAQRLGVDRSTLANNLRVLNLPDLVLEHVESGALRVSAARSFLVLQNADHAHIDDMRDVVRQITNTHGRSGAPDWGRRHVRKLISERVAINEADFRPLGPRPQFHRYGASREPAFDIAPFSAELPKTLHTIPADDDYEGDYESSRTWTCDVKAWRGWQTRATREANKEAEKSGGKARAAGPKSQSRDKQFEQILAKDPVWIQIAASRATTKKRGPNRPVTDEERERLGTRAELREVAGYGEGFWKRLQKGNSEDIHVWTRDTGGLVPPWFPDLKECQNCTIGATYAKSRGGYPLRDITLVCFNREHFEEKSKAGEAAYREKVDAQTRGSERQDSKTIERLVRQFEPLSEDACRAVAVSLLAAEPELEWQHPLGAFHEDWSYQGGPAARVRELLGAEVTEYGRWDRGSRSVDVKSLDGVAAEHLPELAAALVAHHLRLAGRIATVSSETPAAPLATAAA